MKTKLLQEKLDQMEAGNEQLRLKQDSMMEKMEAEFKEMVNYFKQSQQKNEPQFVVQRSQFSSCLAFNARAGSTHRTSIHCEEGCSVGFIFQVFSPIHGETLLDGFVSYQEPLSWLCDQSSDNWYHQILG